MVIKGCSRGGAVALAAHLLRTDTNERAELRELKGVAAKDLVGALREMEAVAAGARSVRHFYHASINTRADEVMTPQQWQRAIDRLERELGLVGQPRAVVAHVKEGRAHVHIAWSRIEIDTLKAIPDSHNYRRHELVSRELERELGHERVQGAHVERDGDRPARTPSHAEMQQAARTRLTPAEAKAQVTEVWNRTDSGKAFAAAIEDQGWTLARGDRRDFVLIDKASQVHSLARRVEGATAKDIRARMSDVDVQSVQSVGVAKQRQKARQSARELSRKVDSVANRPLETMRAKTSSGARAGWDVLPNAAPAERSAADRPPLSAGDEDMRRRGDRLSTTTEHGGMVAQQSEAQRRFNRYSAVGQGAHSNKQTSTQSLEQQDRERVEREAREQADKGGRGR